MPATKLIGADTSLLVAHSLIDHPDHRAVKNLVNGILARGDLIALCPVVVDEFIDVVTDPRRFEKPLEIAVALSLAQTWCQSKETLMLHTTDESLALQLNWLKQYRLGRKRLHDTQIATIFHLAGVKTILSSNWRDFGVFDCFEVTAW